MGTAQLSFDLDEVEALEGTPRPNYRSSLAQQVAWNVGQELRPQLEARYSQQLSQEAVNEAFADMARRLEDVPTTRVTKDMPAVAQDGTLAVLDLGDRHLWTPPPALTDVQRWARKHVRVMDFFSGWGGTSLGALMAGIWQIEAHNHWPYAVAIHGLNLPGRAFVTDLLSLPNFLDDQLRMWDGPGEAPFGYADIVWNSAPCPPHSAARVEGHISDAILQTAEARRAYLEKGRTAAEKVFAHVRIHRPKIVISENVPGFRKWDGYNAWLKEWDDLRYVTIDLSLNAWLFGTPQIRDRGIWIHLRRDIYEKARKYFEFRPNAECRNCNGRSVQAVQTWKNGKTWGSYTVGRDHNQYVYTCPRCHETVIPENGGSAAKCLDWSDRGQRVDLNNDKSFTTFARVQAGLDRLYAEGRRLQPLLIKLDRSNEPWSKPGLGLSDFASPTITTRQEFSIAFPPGLGGPNDPAPLAGPMSFTDCTIRLMTPREAANIQDVPPDFHIGSRSGSLSSLRSAFRAAGNAVPARLAEWVFTQAIHALYELAT